MQYVLGNMLNGGGGLNADGLALDLQFAADKTLTARKGPTPVFTRASSGTYFGPRVEFNAFVFYTTGVQNGRAFWEYRSGGGDSYSFEYSGTNWQLRVLLASADDPYFVDAAAGSEWRPDQANWSESGISVTTSSTFGIVRAATNEPRFDHTSAGVCRGLLIEESRTNLILQSDNFASASWVKNAASISSNVEPAPDDSVSADKLITDNGVTLGRAAQTFTLTGSHVYSVFAKASEWGWISIFPSGAVGGVWFDLVNGVVGTQGSGRVGSITSFGNGWYRCAVQFTGAGTSNTTARIISTNADGVQSTGDGTSGIFIWGAQLEAGSFATSYIPTVASSVVRSADVCSITGANFTSFYNPVEGSLAASVIFNAPVANATSQAIVDINDTTTANRLRVTRNNATGFSGFSNTSNSTQNVSIAGSVALQPLTTQKYSSGFKLDDYAFYVNNAQIGTDNLGAMPISVTTFTIGDASAAFSPRLYLNGTLAAIRYYRKRLPNAKLQALTA
jgi:hypothetical protein